MRLLAVLLGIVAATIAQRMPLLGQEGAPGSDLQIEAVPRTDSDRRDVLSPDRKYRLVASANVARLRDADKRRPTGPPMTHDWIVEAVCFSPDGRLIATGAGSEARLWDTATGTHLGRFPVRKYWCVSAVAISPDNKRLATGIYDLPGDYGEVWIWDIGRREVLQKIRAIPGRGSFGPVHNLDFSGDGRTLLVGSKPVGGR